MDKQESAIKALLEFEDRHPDIQRLLYKIVRGEELNEEEHEELTAFTYLELAVIMLEENIISKDAFDTNIGWVLPYCGKYLDPMSEKRFTELRRFMDHYRVSKKESLPVLDE